MLILAVMIIVCMMFCQHPLITTLINKQKIDIMYNEEKVRIV